MVKEVVGEAEFHSLTGQKGKLVVVDFTATWCGPCKMVAPQYEQLASQHPDVLFLKVVEDTNRELIVSIGIGAFPTFRFYLEGNQIDETKGANIKEVTAKVVQHKAKVNKFQGEGMSLGGASSESISKEDARSKRLARFGSEVSSGEGAKPDPEVARRNAKLLAAAMAEISSTAPSAASAGGSTPMDVDPSSVGSGSGGSQTGGSKPRRTADPQQVSELVEMGFAEVRAKKGLVFGAGPDVESAVNWLMDHQTGMRAVLCSIPLLGDGLQLKTLLNIFSNSAGTQDDPDIDGPLPDGGEDSEKGASTMEVESSMEGAAGGGDTAGSSKAAGTEGEAGDTGSVAGHSGFCEDTQQSNPLTPEERAAKVAKMKEILAARRAAREVEEKVDDVQREKARRTMGKEALKTQEEMEVVARKNEATRAKKEKEEFARERERLREEIARDKAERKARGGRLASKLGVDGYNPSAPQAAYGAPADGEGRDKGSEAESGEGAKPQETSEEKVVKAVDMLARQSVAGLGGTAMKTCLAYIKNALLKPEEEKFRSINLDNNAYKTRVASCIGGTALLRAVGFAKEEGRLFMSLEARDEALLSTAKAKLEAALASYVPTKAS